MARLVKKAAPVEPDFLPHVYRIAKLAEDCKAEYIVAYDVRGLTLIADCFMVCTVKSEPQMKAVTNAVQDGMRAVGASPLSVEGPASSCWMLMDYSTIIFHVFRSDARAYYDLDGFWADAPKIELDLDPAG